MIQVHSKFMIFTSTPMPDGSLDPEFGASVCEALRAANLAPKSVGIEYVESQDLIVLSIGYGSSEPGYPVKLTCIPLGTVPADQRLGTAMSEAAAQVDNVICHEFYVNKHECFFLVLLSKS